MTQNDRETAKALGALGAQMRAQWDADEAFLKKFSADLEARLGPQTVSGKSVEWCIRVKRPGCP